ncbi:MAG: hypothetical protein WCT40_05125 [Candidatus Magasanikbacteria bacterium]|jgi:hypothetical protein
MDGLKSLLTIPNKPANKNIHSEAHYWADVISTAFGERKKFAMYLGTINRIGVSQARQIFSEINDGHAESPAKLFFWMASKKSKKI